MFKKLSKTEAIKNGCRQAITEPKESVEFHERHKPHGTYPCQLLTQTWMKNIVTIYNYFILMAWHILLSSLLLLVHIFALSFSSSFSLAFHLQFCSVLFFCVWVQVHYRSRQRMRANLKGPNVGFVYVLSGERASSTGYGENEMNNGWIKTFISFKIYAILLKKRNKINRIHHKTLRIHTLTCATSVNPNLRVHTRIKFSDPNMSGTWKNIAKRGRERQKTNVYYKS